MGELCAPLCQHKALCGPYAGAALAKLIKKHKQKNNLKKSKPHIPYPVHFNDILLV